MRAETSTRPHTHSAIAAAISGELGFTVLLTNSTIGVIAIASATATNRGKGNWRNAVMAVATNAAADHAADEPHDVQRRRPWREYPRDRPDHGVVRGRMASDVGSHVHIVCGSLEAEHAADWNGWCARQCIALAPPLA